MKNKVIEFFQNLPQAEHEQFNAAFELYRNSPGKNLGIERSLNSSGFSKRALANLLYDLQKMHGVTDVEKIAAVVEVKKLKVESRLPEGLIKMSEEEIVVWMHGVAEPEFNIDEIIKIALEEDQQMIAAVIMDQLSKVEAAKEAGVIKLEDTADLTLKNKDLTEENEDLNADKEDLEIENEDLKDENESLKSENESLKLLKKTDIESIRVEFPFLKEKDCPDEFKILIADKITAWNEYVDAQDAIAKHHAGDTLAEGDLAELAKIAVEAFDENQKIYEELNCYATFGRVLGIHPIFKKLQLSREVDLMTADELIAYKGATAKYFSVNKTALAKAEKAKDTVKITEINNRVAERSEKLFLVNKKLGVKNK
jgi:FtsZ-binding cell division protein ZapB